MKKTATAVSLFVLYAFFIGSGSLWVLLAQLLPTGYAQEITAGVFGVAFAAAFLWLLTDRLRRLYAGHGTVARELAFAAVNVGLLILAFATVYNRLGIADTTKAKRFVSYNFWEATYFSVVTFTTLGYGDFQPEGVVRLIACVESFTGYLVLGITASTAAELLKSQGKEQARQREREREQDDEVEQEDKQGN